MKGREGKKKRRKDEGWRNEGKRKGKVRDVGVKLEPLHTFVYFGLFPPLPIWDCLLWSCPGARSRINILAIQATSCQQALSFEQCASSGWMLTNDDHESNGHVSASTFTSTKWNWANKMVRGSKQVLGTADSQSPLVGPHNDAPEADVVARKGFGAPIAEGTRGNAMQQASGPGGNLGAGLNRVLRSSYSGPHGIPRGIYSTWGLSVLGMYSGEGQRDQVWFYKLCELGTPLSFFKPQSPDL